MTVALAEAAVHLPPSRATEVGGPWLTGNPTEARMILPAAAAAAVTRDLRQPTPSRCWRGREGAARQQTLVRKRRTLTPFANGLRRSLPRHRSRDWRKKKVDHDMCKITAKY
ncbi:unnamed protein product, partial [Ectocarpus fasciculatus]